MKRQVEAEVAAKFPAALFDRMIEHHCRKGLRSDCDCDFCQYKRVATGQFSYLRRNYYRVKQSTSSWDEDAEYHVKLHTIEKRRKVRAELDRIKADI